MQHKIKYSHIVVLILLTMIILSCNNKELPNKMKEKQITFNRKTHALDNNDNFSPDGKCLCYDTRGMVFNNNLANSKSIEKVEIATGIETVLWEPESVSGENGAPGVAAVSYHPTENKVIFIHGPLLEEVEERGYYDIRNRTGVEVSADGKEKITKVDMRDVEVTRPTIPGAQRGGTHRHEYSRNGKRVGFTYDDLIQQDYDRSIGYMEENPNAPKGSTHYFAVLLKPVKKGTSKPGEIEKAYSDAWVDKEGTKRAFIGKVRSENGVDYETSLFVSEISNDVDITTAYSGDKDTYPIPPKGVKIRRLTHSKSDDQPVQITHFKSDASNIRWHSSDHWIFSISNGLIYASYKENNDKFGTTVLLTEDDLERGNLVVSPDGNMLAYNIDLPVKKNSNEIIEDKAKKYKQVFILELNWDQIKSKLNK